jgi:dolichol-phosphate mannosyltransferase
MPKMVSALFLLPIPDLRLLVVDDNSPDQTGQISERLSLEYPGRIKVLHRPRKLGLGTAYITGFQQALADGADAVTQMDADFSHPPDLLVKMAELLETCDAVLGSRYIPGGQLDTQWPLWRKGLSQFGNVYARTILGMPIHDLTGGFRMWRSQTLKSLPLERVRSTGYIFQVELAYITSRLNFQVKEIPFYFADRRWGKSKMNFRIQLEAAFRVWKLPWIYRDLKRKING